MHMLQFVYPSLEGWIFGLFFLAFMNDVAISIHVQVYVWTHIFVYHGNTPRCEFAALSKLCKDRETEAERV